MGNLSVFISPELTMELIERKLAAAAGVIKTSPDISSLCSKFVWYSLCATVLPVCATPEETNHHYFLNKNKSNRTKVTPLTNIKAKKSNSPKNNKKTQKHKGATNGILIVPTQTPTYETPTTTMRQRTIDYYSNSNSYYEEVDGKNRKRRDVDIQFIKNG